MGRKKSKYIDGIYNYCDRWCERCQFTSQCRLFDMGEEISAGEKRGDLTNETFWRALEKTFDEDDEQTVFDECEQRGIDINWAEVEAEMAAADSRPRRRRPRTGINVAAERYMDAVRKYLQENEREFEKMCAVVPPGTPLQTPIRVDDALNVISWYHTFLTVKLMRACKVDDDVDEELEDDDDYAEFQKQDSDCSAKLALIGIDRSIQAWAAMRPHFQGKDDFILKMLAALNRLRKMVEGQFPAARKFKRPGFDV